MSMINTNHIRLRYKSLGQLALSDDIKEELLSGASYLSNNLHVTLVSNTSFETGMNTTATSRFMIDPNSLFQSRYITPSAFHIKMFRPDRMNWKTFEYNPESNSYMYYGCGLMFGNVNNSLLAKYDPSISHDTMLADFLACTFIEGMQGNFMQANMYMAASNMIATMIIHSRDTEQFNTKLSRVSVTPMSF